MHKNAVFVMVLFLVCITTPVMAGDDDCGGVTYTGNPFNCSIICSNDANCTWWAYAQRPDLYPTCYRDAGYWYGDAAGTFDSGSTPLVGSIACFTFGHVAYVRYVHNDGSFWVSEQNCDYGPGEVVYKQYTTASTQGFIYDGPVPYRQTQTPQQLIDTRKTTALNDRNPYGWPQSPQTAFGSFSTSGWWFEFLNYNPWVYNSDDGTPMNCYLSLDDGGDCDAQECAGIVYDVLGGAQYAYMVGWEKWQIWEALTDDLSSVNKSCPTSDCYESDDCNSGQQRIGGPSSCLGMPITNSYETGPSSGVWRQDFQKGYIQNGTLYCYPTCSPGWASGEIWNNRYSYLFADAYDRNGGARDVGNATGRVQVLSGNILIQKFLGGNDTPSSDTGMIMYDQENWDGNPAATNEAYWLYGDFYNTCKQSDYLLLGSSYLGPPTTDRMGDVQYFKYGRIEDGNGTIRAYDSNGECIWNCPVSGAGGPDDDSAPSADAILVRRINSETYEWRVCISNGSSAFGQETVWKSDFGSDDNQYYLGDFNGDSYADILAIETVAPSIMKLRVATSNGIDAFVFQGIWSYDFGASHSEYVIGDFNGDGKDDVAHCTPDPYNHSIVPIRVALSTGHSFGPSVEWSEDFGNSDCRWYGGDFDGNGTDDICYNFDQTSSTIPWRVSLSTDSSFGSSELWYSDFGNAGQVYLVGDFTGDGKCDAAHSLTVTSSQIKWYVAPSTGSSFGNSTAWSTDFGNLGSEYFAGDMKYSDGKCDLVNVLGSNSTYVWHTTVSSGSDFGSSVNWKSDFGDPGDQFFLANVAPNSEYSAKVVSEEESVLPATFTLKQNYPNPFNPVTTVLYTLPTACDVTLCVYNILGQKVETLVNEHQPAGKHTITWDANHKASGVYFYRLQAGDAVETKKMILLK